MMLFKISALCLMIGAAAATNYGQSGSGYSNFGSSAGGQLSQFANSYGGGDDKSAAAAYGSLLGGAGGVGGQDYGQQQVIEVSPDQLPVQVHFRTASSRLNVQQSHNPNIQPQVEHASFQDEPHRVVHEVVKPVIQEVREIIQPYRRVTQEIRPVIEEVHTVVHKGENRRPLGGGGMGGGGLGGGLGGGKTNYGQPSYKSKAKA